MKLLKNRVFLSILCLVLAGTVSFLILPKFYKNKSTTVTVLRAGEDIQEGTEIQNKSLVTVEVGGYGLPESVINDKALVVGKIAQTDIAKGDYFFPQKLSGTIANELLDRIAANNQCLVSVSMPSIAAGLSSHLQSGDIVTVAVFADKASNGQNTSPKVVIYPELKGMEVYSVENARAQNTAEVRKQLADTKSSNGDPIPKTVTLIVTEAQAAKLVEVEYTGKLHLIFEKRGVGHEQ